MEVPGLDPPLHSWNFDEDVDEFEEQEEQSVEAKEAQSRSNPVELMWETSPSLASQGRTHSCRLLLVGVDPIASAFLSATLAFSPHEWTRLFHVKVPETQPPPPRPVTPSTTLPLVSGISAFARATQERDVVCVTVLQPVAAQRSVELAEALLQALSPETVVVLDVIPRRSLGDGESDASLRRVTTEKALPENAGFSRRCPRLEAGVLIHSLPAALVGACAHRGASCSLFLALLEDQTDAELSHAFGGVTSSESLRSLTGAGPAAPAALARATQASRAAFEAGLRRSDVMALQKYSPASVRRSAPAPAHMFV